MLQIFPEAITVATRRMVVYIVRRPAVQGNWESQFCESSKIPVKFLLIARFRSSIGRQIMDRAFEIDLVKALGRVHIPQERRRDPRDKIVVFHNAEMTISGVRLNLAEESSV